MIRSIIPILIAVEIAGCSTAPIRQVNATKEQVTDRCRVVHDDFKKETHVRTPDSMSGGLFDSCLYHLSAVVPDNSGAVSYFVFASVDRELGGWGNWTDAADDRGTKFQLQRVDSRVTGANAFSASVNEVVAAPVTREYLDSIKDSGVRWQIYGRTRLQFQLRPATVSGFLERVDKVRPSTAITAK